MCATYSRILFNKEICPHKYEGVPVQLLIHPECGSAPESIEFLTSSAPSLNFCNLHFPRYRTKAGYASCKTSRKYSVAKLIF